MAPDPAWADTVSAAGAQRGSCAVVIGAVVVGAVECAVAAAVVSAGPTDDSWVGVAAFVAARRAGDGDAAEVVAGRAAVVAVVTEPAATV